MPALGQASGGARTRGEEGEGQEKVLDSARQRESFSTQLAEASNASSKDLRKRSPSFWAPESCQG